MSCGVREPLPARMQEAVDNLDRTEHIFSLQKHHAKSLHWDLRIQSYQGDTMLSWALPKGLPTSKEDGNRLGIRVEDHPLDYADFHGTIPEGYGAGKVELEDIGFMQILKCNDDYYKVVLEGTKYQGIWSLRHTKGKNWIVRVSKE